MSERSDQRRWTHTLRRNPAASGALTSSDGLMGWERREWLLSGGEGSYAMGTAMGANTRRYHGLLVAANRPPVDRILALSQVVDELALPAGHPEGEPDWETRRPLASCHFAGGAGTEGSAGPVRHPEGHRGLTHFHRGLTVAWTYRWGGLAITRELILHRHAPAATLRWALHSPGSDAGPSGTHADEDANAARAGAASERVMLWVRPMVALRGFHGLSHAGDGPVRLHHAGQTLAIRRGGGGEELALTLHFPGGELSEQPDWWYGFDYAVDRRRGQEPSEDLYTPGPIGFELSADRPSVELTAALDDQPADPVRYPEARAAAIDRVAERLPVDDDRLARILAIAADDFVLTPPPASEADAVDAGSAKDDAAGGVSGGETSGAASGGDSLCPPGDAANPGGSVGPGKVGPSRTTVLAGYPWFADWGRDTLIALPGLLLSPGRLEEASAVLRSYAEAMRDGLVPNRFDDRDPEAAEYNTVDASLWYVHAALAYNEASGDDEAWGGWLGRACASVVHRYRRAVGEVGPVDALSIPIAMDPADGLIVAGDARTNLTWMDAEVEGRPVTPRFGKAVEINALWAHALAGLADRLPGSLAEDAKVCRGLADRVAASFEPTFWHESAGYLCDHIVPGWHADAGAVGEGGQWVDPPGDRAGGADGGGPVWRDQTLRPNMVIALSLASLPLARDKAERALWVARDRLLTPRGLRTLAVDDPQYRGGYDGPAEYRDQAYHRGAVWPWLIGPYAEAERAVGGGSDEAEARARNAIAPLLAALQSEDDGEGGIDEEGSANGGDGSGGGAVGQLAEIHRGDDLAPRGCPAQAWSVAAVLRGLRGWR